MFIYLVKFQDKDWKKEFVVISDSKENAEKMTVGYNLASHQKVKTELLGTSEKDKAMIILEN